MSTSVRVCAEARYKDPHLHANHSTRAKHISGYIRNKNNYYI